MNQRTAQKAQISLSKLKQLARARKGEQGVGHRTALDLVAREHGFQDWNAAKQALSPAAEKTARGSLMAAEAGEPRFEPEDELTKPGLIKADSGENWHLFNTGQRLPEEGDHFEWMMRGALAQARREALKPNGKTRLIGFNMLLEREDGLVLDGGFNTAKIIKPGGRDWAAQLMRGWIFKYKVQRVAIYMDLRPESKKGLPTRFAIIGMEDSRTVGNIYEFTQLLEPTWPEPVSSAPAQGFWCDAFKLGRFEAQTGERHDRVRSSAIQLL